VGGIKLESDCAELGGDVPFEFFWENMEVKPDQGDRLSVPAAEVLVGGVEMAFARDLELLLRDLLAYSERDGSEGGL